MSVDRGVLLFAGCMIWLSLALAVWVSSYWLWFTAFIGFNMIQSVFTGFCPAAMILKRLGLKPGSAF